MTLFNHYMPSGCDANPREEVTESVKTGSRCYAVLDDSKKAWIIVSICIGLAALLIAVIFLVSTTLIKDTDMKEGDRNIPSGGSGSGGGGGGEMVVPPAPGPLHWVTLGKKVCRYPITFATMTTTTESTTTTTTTTSTTTTTTTTTTTPPPPLLCSVGLIASLPSQFPPDKICDILIFTHVIVHERKIRVVENEASLEAFRKACAPYSETTCGLSFDVRTDVDIVVLITSVLSIPDRQQCITMPANALRSPNSYPPVMDKAFPTIESSFGTPGLLVAFSLQMGVL
ncbi:hypothetical protein V5799_005917, partial [Amblyomma americanum]